MLWWFFQSKVWIFWCTNWLEEMFWQILRSKIWLFLNPHRLEEMFSWFLQPQNDAKSISNCNRKSFNFEGVVLGDIKTSVRHMASGIYNSNEHNLQNDLNSRLFQGKRLVVRSRIACHSHAGQFLVRKNKKVFIPREDMHLCWVPKRTFACSQGVHLLARRRHWLFPEKDSCLLQEETIVVWHLGALWTSCCDWCWLCQTFRSCGSDNC